MKSILVIIKKQSYHKVSKLPKNSQITQSWITISTWILLWNFHKPTTPFLSAQNVETMQ